MSDVFFLDVGMRLAEISTFWPGTVAEYMSAGIQLLYSMVISNLATAISPLLKGCGPPMTTKYVHPDPACKPSRHRPNIPGAFFIELGGCEFLHTVT
jgi:hypothetical protein